MTKLVRKSMLERQLSRDDVVQESWESWADYASDVDTSTVEHSYYYDDNETIDALHGKMMSAPFVVQWQWVGGGGKRYSFSADANRALETYYHAYQVGDCLQDENVQLHSGSCMYNINFELMTQENTSSGRRREIVREINLAQWSWAGCEGTRWHKFSQDATHWLEQSYQDWCDASGCAQGVLEINDTMYEIDLDRMTQRNQTTGRERSINRKLTTYEAESGDLSPILDTPTLNGKKSKCEAREVVLKVAFDGDRRRLQFQWDSDADCDGSFKKLCTVVCIGFNLEATSQLSFRYKDDDGDLCTLVPDTLHDCFSFSSNGVLNLVAEQAAFPSGARESVSPSTGNLKSCAISISSPPATPRNRSGSTPRLPIDEEYDSTWSLIEFSTDSAK